MKSVMSHNFSRVPSANIPRSVFDRSHGHKTTFNAGDLIPIYADEALPGDTFKLNMTSFARLNTPIVPIMDNMFLDVQFFAVPVRLLWNNWQKFNGEQANPADSTDYLVPTLTSTTSTGYSEGSLWDYLGIPPGVPDLVHNALHSRAYNLIYNEWYRDQNLQDSVVVDLDDGPDSPADYTILKRGKRHDYFTSCLPWPQKGDAVSIGLSGNIPVVGIGVRSSVAPSSTPAYDFKESDGGTDTYNYTFGTFSTNSVGVKADTSGTGAIPQVFADLSQATAITINDLREAFQIQKLYERDARGGTRYTEILRSHFGVVSPDARLQRPEFLGGASTPISITPIPQTSSTDATTPQGNLAGFGVASSNKAGFTKSFVEHCVLLGIASVRADLNYQQGLDRMWSRQTRWDFYWPALSHIGEQAVLNKEIFAQDPAVVDGNGNPVNDNVFGYQERYAEYRYKPSIVSGAFRSSAATTLDFWHLAQDFASLPVLDATFIQENPPVDRIVAVNTEPDVLFDSYFKIKCARPMPVYGVPGLIDHF